MIDSRKREREGMNTILRHETSPTLLRTAGIEQGVIFGFHDFPLRVGSSRLEARSNQKKERGDLTRRKLGDASKQVKLQELPVQNTLNVLGVFCCPEGRGRILLERGGRVLGGIAIKADSVSPSLHAPVLFQLPLSSITLNSRLLYNGSL